MLSAIAGTLTGSIARAYAERAADQRIVVDRTVIDGPAAARAFADRLTAEPRIAFGSSAIGAALLFGLAEIEGNGFAGFRRVIDLSGDSANSWFGPPVGAARDAVVAAGVTINGLPILCLDCASRPAQSDLLRRYEREIIGGPGVFAIAVENRARFVEAVRRKLILEISGTGPGGVAALQGR